MRFGMFSITDRTQIFAEHLGKKPILQPDSFHMSCYCQQYKSLVSLQEVWSQDVYERMVSQVQEVLPYHHYFYSGWHGSGLCIFSKHPIIGSHQYRFTLNGFPHKPHHPDWYGGKMVGLCQVQHPGAEINMYVTHTHTEYNHEHDKDKAHRVSQAFELSQFIRHTGRSADVNILAGDLNNQPFELGLKIIQSNTGMEDSWLTAEHKNAEDSGLTWNLDDNNYTCYPDYPPCRYDYVFYKGSARCRVKCVHCETTMHKVPGKPFNYSDHEGVLAHLELEKVSEPLQVEPITPDLLERDASLRQAVQILEEKIGSAASSRLFYTAVLLLCLLLILPITSLPLHHLVTSLISILLGFLIGWSFWMGAVVTEMERRGCLATKSSMEVLLNASSKKHI
ncbi:SMPD2 [Branchiostoma lanceolatum]|uniref:sphingomyelin phosphodiesterase n=2 Tax=Branchiostoma lanceolatum TaxID=7740 RepID=A0A8J9ZCU7_BRALA|nr:SMPD2 [Branchiostoma lanceolatum]